MKKTLLLPLCLLAPALAAALVTVPWQGALADAEPTLASDFAALDEEEDDEDALLSRGYLRDLAVQAADALREGFPGGVGAELDAWLAEVATPQSDDDLVVFVAQLKELAALFYDRLIEEGAVSDYPWDDGTFPAADDELATVGQAEELFDFVSFSVISNLTAEHGKSPVSKKPLVGTGIVGGGGNFVSIGGLTVQIAHTSNAAQMAAQNAAAQNQALQSTTLGGSSGPSNAPAPPADVFNYDVRGWLSSGSLDTSSTIYFSRDAEGNITQVQ